MAQVRFIDDAGQLQTRTLDTEQCLIGRAPTCQIILIDDTISREHARIELESGGRYRIRDLASRNKTFVNGEMITETLLTGGDVVRVGARVCEFLDDASPGGLTGLEFLTPDRTDPPDSEWVKLKAPVSLTTRQLERLAHLTAERRVTARAEDIADSALGQILLELQAERGWVALRGDSKTEFSTLAHRGLKRPSGGSLMPVSQAFISTPALQGAAGRYPQTAAQLNAKLGYAATAMITALTAKNEHLGVLYVDRPIAKKPFTGSDLQYLVAAGSLLGATFSEASQKLVRDATRETAAWVTTLRRVQSSLAPQVASSPTFSAAVKLMPGRARCGDFADVIHLDEQRSCALLVDVGGHGITGLAQAYAIRAAVRAALRVSEDALMDPGPMLAGINAMIAASTARQVIPCLYVALDVAAGKLTYVNAGGAPPLLLPAPGRLMTLDQGSLVFGVDQDAFYDPTRVDLPDAFRLVCHTDGLIEACNSAGEPLGPARLHEGLLAPEAFGPVQDTLARIDAIWTTHAAGMPADDDALVLVLGRG